jgi:hypothetical protein
MTNEEGYMRNSILGTTILLIAVALSAQIVAAETATITLTSAQLQSLRDTPVVLVPAPGPNSYINASSATLQYNYGTTNYPGGHGHLEITLGPYDSLTPIPVFDGVLTAGFLDQDSDQQITLEAGPLDASPQLENLDLEIVNFGPPLTDGDGTLSISVSYTLVTRQ